jgi:hypothetical protein
MDQGIIASGVGTDGEDIRFADLNSDGRAEYLSIGEDGSVTAYLNGGYTYINDQDGKINWIEQGVIATGAGGTRENIFFGAFLQNSYWMSLYILGNFSIEEQKTDGL